MKAYWDRVMTRRLTRRSTLLAAGAGVAALTLAGCGGGGGDAGKAKATSRLTDPQDTSKRAVKGGVWQNVATQDVPTFDVNASTNNVALNQGQYIYSRIFKKKSIPLGPQFTAEFEGDIVDSWEVADGGTRWIMKLRPNAKMHNVAPLNGRLVDAEDVTMSWDRFSKLNPARARFDMVDSVTSPDSRTVVFTNSFPYGAFSLLFTSSINLYVTPKEIAQEKVDYRAEGFGSGPWIFDTYQRSSLYRYKRNPDYFLPGLPYPDAVEFPIIPEYAQRLAQFKAGRIDSLAPTANDILTTATDVPTALIWAGEFNDQDYAFLFPRSNDPVFDGVNGDVRIRRAISMALDRDTYAEVIGNTPALEAAGFDIQTKWNNVFSVGRANYLDPQSRDAGDSGKWYKFDLAEAKKLLSAAGHANGIEGNLNTTTISGTDQQIGAVNGFLQEAGIRLTRNQGDLQQDFYGRWAARGDFKGLALATIATGTTTEDDAYLRTYFTGGAANPSGRNSSGLDDSKLNSMIDGFRREFDANKRRDLAWNIQRYISDNMWVVPVAAQSTSNLTFSHPWLMNFRVFRQTPDSLITTWIDQTKRKA